MANISDIIEQFLLSSLSESDKISISRNELADYFACAPSQINYVLATRFTLDRGFIIESRRGGGGYVTVLRVGDESDILNELSMLNISDGLSFTRATQLVDRFVSEGYLSGSEGELIRQLLTDKALVAPGVNKDALRASLIKSLALYLRKKGGRK